MNLTEQEVHWYRNDGSKPTPRRKALNRADEFDNRGQNDRANKIRSIVISKDHADTHDARRKAKNIKVDDNKVGKLPVAAKSDKRDAIDVKHNLKKLKEVAPPGFGHTKSGKGDKEGGTAAAFDRARKEGRFKGSKSDMFAIMWSQKKKGAKPHYKPGTNKKYKKYQEEETSMPHVKEKDRGAIKKRFKGLFKKDIKGTVQGVNEGKLSHLAQASVLSASDDPKDQDRAREIKTRFDYESLKRQIGSKKKHDKPAYKDFVKKARKK